MADKMNSLERVRAALAGESVDRPAVSLWRHYYERETTAPELVDAMLRWQRTYGWDFMKVNPRAQYHIEPWGAKVQYFKDGVTKTAILDLPVKKSEDWASIKPVGPTDGALGEQLQTLDLLKRALKGDQRILFVETIFSPLSIAGDLADPAQLKLDLSEHPDLVHAALEAITSTFERYVAECINLADGIFFATTEWGSRDQLTAAQYAEFGRPYDQRVLQATQEAEFNILHVCKDNDLLLDLLDYPVRAFSWATHGNSNPGLTDMLPKTDKALIGGVALSTLKDGNAEDVHRQLLADLDAVDGSPRWLAAADCSVDVTTPAKNVAAVADTVKGMRLLGVRSAE
jgi:uroporphyrinogen decarboxylase